MFKELKISNFRGFRNEITVTFAPITVLIGRNNAGKSSIIKFLLMLQQSLKTGSGGFLVSRGQMTDLGPFHNLKNTASKAKHLSFSLTMEDNNNPRGSLYLFLKEKIGKIQHQHQRLQTTATISYSRRPPFQGKNHSFSLTVEGKKILGRRDAIKQNSAFLDFADSQQLENSKKSGDSNMSRQIDAEKACVEIIADKILAIRHIGPDKKTIPRSFDTGEFLREADVGQDGRFAPHHLWNIHKRADHNEINFVNSYMENVLNMTDVRFSNTGDSDLSQCFAKNQIIGTESNLADFGYGVSQCFPILVQGAIMPRYSTLICEQPEAQVHPTAQLELGQFFADLWKEAHVTSIIETHSDSILLRLRRLISKGKLESSDVSVVYFTINDEPQNVTTRNLSIEKDGSMEEGLPMEFFHQNIWEALEIGGGSR